LISPITLNDFTEFKFLTGEDNLINVIRPNQLEIRCGITVVLTLNWLWLCAAIRYMQQRYLLASLSAGIVAGRPIPVSGARCKRCDTRIGILPQTPGHLK